MIILTFLVQWFLICSHTYSISNFAAFFSRGELGGISVDEYFAKFFYGFSEFAINFLTVKRVIVFIIDTYVSQPKQE